MKITVAATVRAPLAKVWDTYTAPEDMAKASA
jgi:hypothetical protein